MMATYPEIRKYVKAKYGFYPQTCWIAHVKELSGIPVKPAPNRHSEDIREKPCPPEKVEAIKNALIHFNMI